MLQVTPEARTELHGMLERAVAHEKPDSDARSRELGFRLVRGSGEDERSQLGLALDSPREGDEIVEHRGCSVLIVDASTAETLTNLTLDVVETPSGTRLGLRE